MFTENWVLSIIPAIFLLIFAWTARRLHGSWLVPSAFFGLCWATFLILPLILSPGFGFWPGASWLILFFGLLLHLGVLIGFSICKMKKISKFRYSRLQWSLKILFISIAFGILAVFVLALRAGYSLTVLSDPQMISRIGLFYASMRYTQGESVPFLVLVFNVFFNIGFFFVGFLLAIKPSMRTKIILMIIIFIGILKSFLVSARTGFIWGLIFLISSYIATLVLIRQHRKFLSFRKIILITFIVTIVVGLFFTIQAIRERETFGDASKALAKTQISTLSPPFLFSYWLKTSDLDMNPSFGTESFNGFFYFLGIQTSQALGWESSKTLVLGKWEATPNVYTAFRQLIEDFTLFGAIIFFVIGGAIIGITYRKVINGKVFWLPILVAFYAWTIGSYLASWLSYTTLFLSWLLFWCLLLGDSFFKTKILRNLKSIKIFV